MMHITRTEFIIYIIFHFNITDIESTREYARYTNQSSLKCVSVNKIMCLPLLNIHVTGKSCNIKLTL